MQPSVFADHLLSGTIPPFLDEAVVIHEFFQLLLAYLGEDISEQAEAFAEKPPMKLLFPLNCITYRPSRPHFIHYCKIGTLQYVVLRPMTTMIAVITQLVGRYCEDSMSPRFAHVWVIVINGISVTVAMFTLVQIYTTVKSELKNHNLVLKFISIKVCAKIKKKGVHFFCLTILSSAPLYLPKFVIFFSFWQTVTFSALAHTNVVRSTPHWSQTEVAASANAFLICFEMAIAALLHVKAFSYRETLIEDFGATMRWPAFKHCLNIYDIMLDVRFAQRFVTHRIRGETYTPADALEEAEEQGLLEVVEDFIEEAEEEIKEEGLDEAEISIRKRDGERVETVDGHVENTEEGVKSVVERTVSENGAVREASVKRSEGS
ncbi:hypothetical protein HDU86_006952 [Geranomyces michiganensis]|nr:hypothetical protein HDU86_006952 [Geranomyces michiganensis]